MKDMITIQNLTKTYGKHRGVEDVTFSVREGEIFGFLGPNGAGKSTTIRSMLGLIKYDQGEIRIKNRLFEQTQQCVDAESLFFCENVSNDSGRNQIF